MADFCKQCSISNFGQDYKELAGIAEEGESAVVLCEGCGLIVVNKDGERIRKVRERLSRQIVNFLMDRNGFDGWWENIDDNIQFEIMEDLEEFIFDYFQDNKWRNDQDV